MLLHWRLIQTPPFLDVRFLEAHEEGMTIGLPSGATERDHHDEQHRPSKKARTPVWQHVKGMFVWFDKTLLTATNFAYWEASMKAITREAPNLEICVLHAVPTKEGRFPVAALTALLQGMPKLKKLDLRSLNLAGTKEEFQACQSVLQTQCPLLEELQNFGSGIIEDDKPEGDRAVDCFLATTAKPLKRLHIGGIQLSKWNEASIRGFEATTNLESLHLDIVFQWQVLMAVGHLVRASDKLVHLSLRIGPDLTKPSTEQENALENALQFLTSCLSALRLFVLELQIHSSLTERMQPFVRILEHNYSCHKFHTSSFGGGQTQEAPLPANQDAQVYVKLNKHKRNWLLPAFQPSTASTRCWTELLAKLGASHQELESQEVLTGVYLFAHEQVGSLTALTTTTGGEPSTKVPATANESDLDRKLPARSMDSTTEPNAPTLATVPLAGEHPGRQGTMTRTVTEESALPVAGPEGLPPLGDWDVVLTGGGVSTIAPRPKKSTRATMCWENVARGAGNHFQTMQDIRDAHRQLVLLALGSRRAAEDDEEEVRFYVATEQAQDNWVVDWSDKRSDGQAVYVRVNDDCVRNDIARRKIVRNYIERCGNKGEEEMPAANGSSEATIVETDHKPLYVQVSEEEVRKDILDSQNARAAKEGRYATCIIELDSKEKASTTLWLELAKAKQSVADNAGSDETDEYAGWVDVLARDYTDRATNLVMLTEVKASLDAILRAPEELDFGKCIGSSPAAKDVLLGLGRPNAATERYRSIVQPWSAAYRLEPNAVQRKKIVENVLDELQNNHIRLVFKIQSRYYQVTTQKLYTEVSRLLSK